MTTKSILSMTQLDVTKPPIVWLVQLERSATLENIGKHCSWRQCPIGDITRGQWALDNNCVPWPQNASKHFYGVVTKEIYKNITLVQCWCWLWCWCWCWYWCWCRHAAPPQDVVHAGRSEAKRQVCHQGGGSAPANILPLLSHKANDDLGQVNWWW